MYFLSFQDFLDFFLLLSVKEILYSKAFKYLHDKKVVDNEHKKGIQTWKQLQKATLVEKCPPKNNS